jgi:hypothetical protein
MKTRNMKTSSSISVTPARREVIVASSVPRRGGRVQAGYAPAAVSTPSLSDRRAASASRAVAVAN